MAENEKDTLTILLDAAKEEFMEKGYQLASLRTIAKKADLTTGALYGHFKNKESLFEGLVGKDYNHLLNLYKKTLADFKELPAEEQHAKMMQRTNIAMKAMTVYVYEHKDSFKLILCKSEGTKYNNLVHELAKLDVDATHDFAEKSAGLGMNIKKVNANLEHMLISGMFSTFFELIIHDIPEEEAEEYTAQLMEFYSAGWKAVMGL